MHKALLAVLAATALTNGCTNYDAPPGPRAYGDYESGRMDAMRAGPDGRDEHGHSARWAERDDRPYPPDPRYGPGPRYESRFEHCRRFDAPGCPPPRMAPPAEYVQPLPPGYPDQEAYAARRPAPVRVSSPPDGGWRVQLGAFCQQSGATALRARLSGMPALSSYRTYLVIAGGMTRVQAGPLPSAEAADGLCSRVRTSGQACVVKRI